MTGIDLSNPPKQFLKAWNFIRRESEFITPERLAEAAQIGHDTAERFLKEWASHGVLRQTPRYPAYVYSRSIDWDRQKIAKHLSRWV